MFKRLFKKLSTFQKILICVGVVVVGGVVYCYYKSFGPK